MSPPRLPACLADCFSCPCCCLRDAAACVPHVGAAASSACASNPCSYDDMVNEYAALLAPDPRQYYHYFAVLPAVDTIQLLNDKVRSAPPAAWHSHPGQLTSAQCIGSKWPSRQARRNSSAYTHPTLPAAFPCAGHHSRVCAVSWRKRGHTHAGQSQLCGGSLLAAGPTPAAAGCSCSWHSNCTAWACAYALRCRALPGRAKLTWNQTPAATRTRPHAPAWLPCRMLHCP